MSPPGRPKGEFRSAQHEGAPVTAAHPALAGLSVLERGWLSSNNVLVHAQGDEAGAWLIDSGHVTQAGQTVDLVRHALRGQPLARLINTHLHSDHCGGNAALQQAFGLPVWVPPGQADAVRAWDLQRLGHDDFGQRERFTIDGTLGAGECFLAGGRRWQVLPAPGHDPHSVMFFDAAAGLLVSADALWADGFGLVFPELVGERGFDDVAAVLETIEQLPVQLVIPGHGAPFTDVAGALQRARARLAAYRADPPRHARHALKVVIKYRLMELRVLPRAELLQWVAQVPLVQRMWTGFGQPESGTPLQWAEQALQALCAGGALRLDGNGFVHDA
jgi:glyoxylase-like metal-dependent hydrolase (beta-lactamase superfamily II)